MTDVLSTLAPFRLEGQIDECFKPIFNAATLRRDEEMDRVLLDYKVPGVYFWLLKHENAYYRIYVGQTKSLSGRLRTYIGNFQSHAPNDFKLQVFVAFANELLPNATFDLYFFGTDGDRQEAERKTIEKYSPLLNKLPQPTQEAKAELQEAFSLYYRGIFQRRLSP